MSCVKFLLIRRVLSISTSSGKINEFSFVITRLATELNLSHKIEDIHAPINPFDAVTILVRYPHFFRDGYDCIALRRHFPASTFSEWSRLYILSSGIFNSGKSSCYVMPSSQISPVLECILEFLIKFSLHLPLYLNRS